MMIKSRNIILILTAVVIVAAIAYFAFATQVPAKIAQDASLSAGGSSSGGGNGQSVTGTATPSPTSRQETTGTFVSRFDPTTEGAQQLPNFNADGARFQGIALNNIPPIIYSENKIISIKNLEIKGDSYMYGYVSANTDGVMLNMFFAFYDENGNRAGTTTNPSYETGKKGSESVWGNPVITSNVGLPKNYELRFRVEIPKTAKYAKIQFS